ncbi:MAG: hypothetical protein JRK53_01635 [Deltaproteobacteria bacterium]|nr:hypothetical protein [Deltaproteobacteria bacterium]MBW1815681.1 hypothetical protein [Deltaproteobacteria bacterium]MBW2285130.1 hypothetical protein [Deltaproteobacteria bacterium]
MARTQDPAVKQELENRLKDLFDESKTVPDGFDALQDTGEFPLRGLKALILSIDWEINDETLNKLADEVERLKATFPNDKVLFLFLQLLASVARYLKANKEKAHPDAVKLLNSIYIKLDKVYLAKDMTQEGRKRILLREIRKFKALKERIAVQKAAAIAASGLPAESGEAADRRFQRGQRHVADLEEQSIAARMDGMTPQEALAVAVAEIRKAIRIEFEALKLELRSREH